MSDKDDGLTVDLDDDEPQYCERMAGRIERLLQSDFCDTSEAVEDFETLLSMFKEIAATKNLRKTR